MSEYRLYPSTTDPVGNDYASLQVKTTLVKDASTPHLEFETTATGHPLSWRWRDDEMNQASYGKEGAEKDAVLAPFALATLSLAKLARVVVTCGASPENPRGVEVALGVDRYTRTVSNEGSAPTTHETATVVLSGELVVCLKATPASALLKSALLMIRGVDDQGVVMFKAEVSA